jgi:hypothetical protein
MQKAVLMLFLIANLYLVTAGIRSVFLMKFVAKAFFYIWCAIRSLSNKPSRHLIFL